jgi:hypothetical protein
MRERQRIIDNLESMYREAYARAEESGHRAEMSRLELEFQRDQLNLEVLLDLRELMLLPADQPESAEGESAVSLLEKAQAVRRLVRFR